MKRNSMIIGFLTVTALVLALLVLNQSARKPAYGDVLATGSDISLLTSSVAFGNVEILNVIDNRDGLMLIYSLNGTRLVLVNAENLNRAFGAPRLH